MRFLLLLTITIFFFGCAKQKDISSDLSNEEKLELLLAESGKELTITQLSKEEVEQYLYENSQNGVSYRNAGGGGTVIGTTSELVIICYDCGGSSETCFGVWGTSDCNDVNCNDGCCCYE